MATYTVTGGGAGVPLGIKTHIITSPVMMQFTILH